jgi:uncharacterized repeat protein (TIGR01451 family)
MGAVAMVVLASCQPVQPWRSALASVDATGADSTALGVSDGVISPDGTKVAFVTRSNDLGPTDTNRAEDVYLRDLTTGDTTLVSVNQAGTDSGNGSSVDPQFSADGTRIAFRSSAGDLAPDAPDEASRRREDVFVRDLSAGQTTQIALFTPVALSDFQYREPVLSFVMSDNFDAVVYTSIYNDSFERLLVHDLATGESTPISDAVDWGGFDAVPSPDGTKVAFTTAWRVVPDDTDWEPDVYVHDVATGTTALVSAPTASSPYGWVSNPTFSPDSTKIVFDSNEVIDPVDSGGGWDVYVRDLSAGTTTLVSVNEAGTDGGNDFNTTAAGARFTEDGSGVIFTSDANDFGPGDTNGASDVYLRDLGAGTTVLLSRNADGTDSADGASRLAPDARPGSRVMFMSTASDLGPRDRNGVDDLYAHDLASGVTTLVSVDAEGTDSGAGWPGLWSDPRVSVSDDGRRVAFLTSAGDLGPTDTNGVLDVYVATLRTADVRVGAEASPEPVASGATLTYQLDVSNAGPDTADDLAAALVLPEGADFASVSTTAGSCEPPTADAPNVVVCTFGSRGPGHVATVTVDADVTAPAGTSLSAVALARSSTTTDDVGDNNTSIIESTVT